MATPCPRSLGGRPGPQEGLGVSYVRVQMLRARGPRAAEGCAGILPSCHLPCRATTLQMAPLVGPASAYRATQRAIGFLPGRPVPRQGGGLSFSGAPPPEIELQPGEARWLHDLDTLGQNPCPRGCRSTGHLGVWSDLALNVGFLGLQSLSWAGPLCLSSTLKILSWYQFPLKLKDSAGGKQEGHPTCKEQRNKPVRTVSIIQGSKIIPGPD